MQLALIPLVLSAVYAVYDSSSSNSSSSSSGSSSTNPYVPVATQCPSSLAFLRKADSVSPGEKSFLQKRDKYTQEALTDWLSNSNLTDFDAPSFLSNGTIRIGLAYSGGGYRAMLAGAGQLAALDNRTSGATGEGQLGGLLQASTYLAGLSGGNWLVGSIACNNFTTVQALQADKKLWQLSNSIVSPGGVNIIKTVSDWDDIIDDVQDIMHAGWNASLTDLWGRGLAYQFLNYTKGGEGFRYSQLQQFDGLTNGEMPFPVHVTDRRNIGETIVSLNSSVFEFNPYELGSWDPDTYMFADLRFIGTHAENGKPTDSNNCTVGYDNAGFLIGTSATLFNQFILQINDTNISGEINKLATEILSDLSKANDDISIFRPNPFYKVDGCVDSDKDTLTLVDGGEDGMNVPIWPLNQPQREVDVLFAFDNSADTKDNWPNGTSLVNTYQRQFGKQANGTHFPYVPDAKTFIENGLTLQPTFFGCNLTNLSSLYVNDSNSDLNSTDGVNIPPVVIYIANSHHSFNSNVATFQLKYDNDERDAMITNGFNTMSQNNGSLDSEWRACLGCAIVLREQQRRNQSPTEQCQKCFQKYCWNGSVASDNDNATPKRPDGQNNTVNAAQSSAAASKASSATSSASSSSSSASSSKKKNNASPSVVAKTVAAFAAGLGAVALLL